MNNIENDADSCFGCGLCYYICPKGAITMKSNNVGFEYPTVDRNKCTQCGLCVRSCPQNRQEVHAVSYKTYACHLREKSDVKKVASGGMGTALAKNFIKNGGIVYGVAYTNQYHRCEYIRVTSYEEIERIKGTKYSQASLYRIIPQILEDLEKGNQVLFFGTPCYVAAIKCITIKLPKQIFFVELICSGVMGPKLEQKLFDLYRKKYNGEIEMFTVKDKKHGYRWPYIYCKINENIISKPLHCTDYGFVYKNTTRTSCYSCRYKDKSTQADITIGDFWGLTSRDEGYYKYGVSAVVSRNLRGDRLLAELDNIICIRKEYDILLKNNPRLKSSREKSVNDDIFIEYFEKQGIEYAIRKTMSAKEIVLSLMKHVFAFFNI